MLMKKKKNFFKKNTVVDDDLKRTIFIKIRGNKIVLF